MDHSGMAEGSTFRQMEDLDIHDGEPGKADKAGASNGLGNGHGVAATGGINGASGGGGGIAPEFERPSALATFANRMMFSTWYTVVYLMLFTLQIILLIWGIVNHDELINNRSHLGWYIALDVLITAILTAEVILRLVATHRTYWKSWLNRIDFAVMVVCVGALFIWIAEPGSVFVDAVAVSFRYAVQAVRVGLVCKHNVEHRKMMRAHESHIDFSTIDPNADPTPETLNAHDVTGDAFDDRASYASVEVPK